MEDQKNYTSFEVEKGGINYKVTIKSIKAALEDRYGWKTDHINVWLEFEPTVGSVSSTGIDLPIANYTKDSLLSAIKYQTVVLIPDMLSRQEGEKRENIIAVKHKATLDDYAHGLNKLLED